MGCGAPTPTLIGLNDLGSTCYMNATLQCLSNIDQLTEYFLKKYKFDPKDKTKIISNEYYQLIKNLWNSENDNVSFSPSTFKDLISKEYPIDDGKIINNSVNLINFLIEKLHTELNKPKSENGNQKITNEPDKLNEVKTLDLFLKKYSNNYNSIISDLFYGINEIKSECCGCKANRFQFQVYNFLDFPLEKINKYCFENGKKKSLHSQNDSYPDFDIYDCFDYYQKKDPMNGDNQMYCNKCEDMKDAFYGTTLYLAPKILIINLNRGKGGIDEFNVTFPEDLNISDYVINKKGPKIFELFAVINHYGPRLLGGYFAAFCKNRLDDNWYFYKNEKVTKSYETNGYLKGTPYILFYRKK